jgi:peptidoglycan-associated lipoprotein
MDVARSKEALAEIVFFQYDSDQLDPEAEDKLRAKAAIMRANPSVAIIVSGHADERGSTEYNLALGQRRAEAVKTFLDGYGIDGGRVSTISFGKERPLVEGSGEAVWARNRRAEFTVSGGEVSTAPPEVF